MALKLNMSKAYDRVEWEFFRAMMIRMGFNPSWIDKVMSCVSSISYLMNINGVIGESFQPLRGLRQHDLLNPFLFLIWSEDLSSLIRLALNERCLRGIRASRREPSISHLLFADNCILFGGASVWGGQVLKTILKEYESYSGWCEFW